MTWAMHVTRRELLRAAGAAGVAALVPGGALAQDTGRAPAQALPAPGSHSMSTRAIPRTGEAIPAIGLGTWQTFDVGSSPRERAPVVEVLRRYLAAGGRVIDSSPMYGRAEAVTGDALAELGATGKPFLATKVWTRGKAAGSEQMERSLLRMRTARIDLMQVHNLLDWQAHLPVLREWKQAGTVRYIGITHYASSAFGELERLMRSETLDFVQLPYNVLHREAEARLLPAALDTGTAVLVMQPFQEGQLFDRVKGKPVPDWAAEIDCSSWAQLFLKFILGHPAVTCPLPATSKPRHVDDNVQAGRGRLPDAALRRKLVALLGA